jgi:hypothetical protein
MTSYMRYWYEFKFIIKGLYPLCFYDLGFTFRLWFSTMLLLCFCLRRLWCVLKKMKHTPFIFFKTRTIKNLHFHLRRYHFYTLSCFSGFNSWIFFNGGIGSSKIIQQTLLLHEDPFGTGVLEDNLFDSQGNGIFTNTSGFLIIGTCC